MDNDRTAKGQEAKHPADGKVIKKLISEQELKRRVEELALEIRVDAQEKEIVLLCVLKGSFIFTADLARALTGKVTVEFLGVASYGDDVVSSGAVQITHDLTQSIEDRYVVLVEDIVDTGLTLSYLERVLKARRPATLKVCALLVKPAGKSPVLPDYTGFEIGDEFVVGYGLDWAQRLRQLPFIGSLDVKS